MAKVSEIVSSKIGETITNVKNWSVLVLNVKEHGLVGDGVTDDTEALQALVDLAISEERKAIAFPHGTYKVTALTNDDQVFFIGDNASFTGGYAGTIEQLGDIGVSQAEFAALEAETVTGMANAVEKFDAKGDWDGITGTDDTVAIQATIDAASLANEIAFLPPLKYRITSTITVPSNTHLLSYGATIVFDKDISAESTRNYPIFRADGKENIIFDGIKFEHATAKAYGLIVYQCTNVTMRKCIADGASLFTSLATGGETYNDVTDADMCNNITVKDNRAIGSAGHEGDGCIEIVFTKNWMVEGNYIENYNHGIMFWGGDANHLVNGAIANERKCKNGIIKGNIVDTVSGGAIWGSMGYRISIVGNHVKNADDVGIDMEGCFHSTATGNTAEDCVNGGLATFFLNRGIVFNGNTVVVNTAEITRMARIFNSSNTQDNKEISFIGNTFSCLNGEIGTIDGDAVENLEIVGNTLRNVRIQATMRATLKNIADNNLIFDVASVALFNALYVGNAFNSGVNKIVNNSVKSTVTQPAESVGIYDIETDFNTNPQVLIQGNYTKGFTTDIHVKGDSANAGISPRFMVKQNVFGGNAFVREEGSTGKSTVLLEGNSSEGGTHFPNAIPTTGKWDRGQIFYYSTPSASGKIGAVCVTAGTPGTWNPWGAIDA